jgi:hypothetical protein
MKSQLLGEKYGETVIRMFSQTFNCIIFRLAAETDCKLWSLGRQDYQAVMTYSGLEQHQQCVKFLQRYEQV